MFSLVTKEVTRQNKVTKITSFQVWFHVEGFGLLETHDELLEFLNTTGLDARVVTPVPVAVCDNGDYEVLT